MLSDWRQAPACARLHSGSAMEARMLLSPALLLASVLAAPGDIYRCRDGTGRVSFQDQPCASGEQARLSGGASEQALRAWLDAQPGGRPIATRTAVPMRPRPAGGVSEAQLALCSERFLHCASDDPGAMDACIARLPGAGCPAACVERYQALRGQGHALAPAVRLALLDPDAPACGVAAR